MEKLLGGNPDKIDFKPKEVPVFKTEEEKETYKRKWFEKNYAQYDELMQKLADLFPFLKMKPVYNVADMKFVGAAEINSVFDVAWLAFQRRLIDDAPNEEYADTVAENPKQIIQCPACKQFFEKTGRRSKYCSERDCQRARNLKNVNNSKKRKAQSLQ